MVEGDENGPAAGLAHDAAWSTVMLRPAEGWRNSYDPTTDPAMHQAHLAAHRALGGFLGECDKTPDEYGGPPWFAAINALAAWDRAGRPELAAYEVFVPRRSGKESRFGGANPQQQP